MYDPSVHGSLAAAGLPKLALHLNRSPVAAAGKGLVAAVLEAVAAQREAAGLPADLGSGRRRVGERDLKRRRDAAGLRRYELRADRIEIRRVRGCA